jgi:anti-sigma regulatory factor (Ser/Thr protein kinase)
VRVTVRAAYPADRSAVALARRFVRETLIGWGADDAIDDAVLLTSELATNAVVHARTPFEVICRAVGATGTTVQVEVVDGDTARVLPAPGKGDDPDRVSGRGLLMPIMLAVEWGVSYGVGSKTVWFRLRTRAEPAAASIPGIELLRPAGGAYDLYDVFEAAPQRWRFAVGGVHGAGPEAAVVTGLARHGLRLLAAEGHGVAAAVIRLNQAVVREGARGRPMTLLHGELVRRTDTGVHLSLVSAGHPPPLRLTAAGDVVPVTGAQPLLGAARDTHFRAEGVDLDRGEALLCAPGREFPDSADLTADAVATCLRRAAEPPVLVLRVRG